jgi:ADP-ribose pyrophosphatase
MPPYKIHNLYSAFKGFFALEKIRVSYQTFAGGFSKPKTYEVFERGDAAAVLPYDPVRDEVVWVEQFRVAAVKRPGCPWLIETVAGIYEPGESAEDLVRREAIEEAGCVISDLEPISTFFLSPGGSSEQISLYCGRIDSIVVGDIHGLAAEGEDIKVHILSYAESVKWYQQGKINSATPMVAMQWLMLNRDRIRRKWA